MSAAVRVTHGRHCPCSACAREDWTRITGPCGMHGKNCPRVYAPVCSKCGGDGYTEAWNDDQSDVVITLCTDCGPGPGEFDA